MRLRAQVLKFQSVLLRIHHFSSSSLALSLCLTVIPKGVSKRQKFFQFQILLLTHCAKLLSEIL